MATESLAPDAIINSSGLDVSGGISFVQDDPNDPDANWFTSNADDGELRLSFPTPSGDPTTGADVQNFGLWMRKDAAGGLDPEFTVELRETGGTSALEDLGTFTVLSEAGELFNPTWDAANLATADGSAVEIFISMTSLGGGPNKRHVEVGAVEWNVDYQTGAGDVFFENHVNAITHQQKPITAHQLGGLLNE